VLSSKFKSNRVYHEANPIENIMLTLAAFSIDFSIEMFEIYATLLSQLTVILLKYNYDFKLLNENHY